MIGILVIVLLAAIVGIIKPYVRGLRRGHFALAAVAAFIGIGVLAPTPDKRATPVAAASSGAATADASAPPAPAASTSAPATKWELSEEKDEMRGTVTRFASLDSENTVDLGFPYGEVRGKLWVRRRAEDGLNVMFAVEKGQILCHAYGNSTVAMKFDDGPIRKFRCSTSSDGSSETAFLAPAGTVLAALKQAKRTVVEAEFFQQGRQQFVFDSAGLQWK